MLCQIQDLLFNFTLYADSCNDGNCDTITKHLVSKLTAIKDGISLGLYAGYTTANIKTSYRLTFFYASKLYRPVSYTGFCDGGIEQLTRWLRKGPYNFKIETSLCYKIDIGLKQFNTLQNHAIQIR